MSDRETEFCFTCNIPVENRKSAYNLVRELTKRDIVCAAYKTGGRMDRNGQWWVEAIRYQIARHGLPPIETYRG